MLGIYIYINIRGVYVMRLFTVRMLDVCLFYCLLFNWIKSFIMFYFSISFTMFASQHWSDKNFIQFLCGGNIIYHIDADELFVSHYDNFIVGTETGECPALLLLHSFLLFHFLRLLLLLLLHHVVLSCCHLLEFPPATDFAASFALLLVSRVELLVKCL